MTISTSVVPNGHCPLIQEKEEDEEEGEEEEEEEQ